MTLEDFFTLTEMKDGLTAPSRVQELVSVMQKERDSVVKNVGDSTRQWAAVASTIAATENKDCLNLFIQLDGLWFINRWLKDAQNFGVDTNDGFLEESITALLRAVEKLHLDSEKSMSSGIWITVRNLLGHHSSRVQDRARILFDNWKVGGNDDAEFHDMEPDGSDKIVREEGQPSAVNEAGNYNDHTSGLVEGEKSSLRSADILLPERVVSTQIQSSNNQPHSPTILVCEDVKLRSPDHLANVSTSVEEVTPIKGLPLSTVGETTSDGTCSIPVPKQGNVEGQSEVLKLNDLSKKDKQEKNVNGPPQVVVAENSLASTKPELGPVSMGATEAKALEPVKEPLQHNAENNEDAPCHKVTASGSMRSATSERKSEVDDVVAINSSSPQLLKTAVKDDDRSALHNSSVSGSDSGKPEVLETSFSKTDYVRAVKEGKGHVSDEGEDTSNGSDSIKPGRGPRSPNMIDKKSSDIELEYGIVDALEVARQVAQEVTREVCSSSSEKISEGGNQQPGSPDSIGREDALPCIPSRQIRSAEAYPEEEGRASTSDNIEDEPEFIPATESSQVTEAAEDPGGNSEKIQCAFDLNEEVGSDDVDVSINAMSTPIPVVSVSKPAATPELPLAPLLFEGTLGWKGSAATSAFRPASPRKNSDSEKNISVSGNSDIFKQRQDWLNFDLNVAEGEDGLGKQVAESSSLPSGQSSVELCPKKSIRLELDLNSIGDDSDAQPSDKRMEGQFFYGRNGHWSPPASASASIQPSVRNIDLNDRPYLQTDLVDKEPSKSSYSIDTYGGPRSDAPVISILGTKVEVSRRELVPHTLYLPNGKASEPAVDLAMTRAGGILGMGPTVSYNHSHVYGYNGLTSASALSFSSAMYGSGGTIPYMVDSRGAPVVPQVMGSSSTLLSSYSQPPFIMSMTGAQHGLNGVGPSRPNFDLNSGFMIEGGNRDALTARQIFFAGQNRPMEEHVRNIPQPSSSGVGMKRKEPDSGWETYPMSHKHPQPPWN